MIKKFSILLIFIFSLSCSEQGQNYTKAVNLFIGTGGHGHTYPGAALPRGTGIGDLGDVLFLLYIFPQSDAPGLFIDLSRTISRVLLQSEINVISDYEIQ
ncbi:MAG: hypothetical protein LBP83_06860 [Dysgonamonadaceae bacterium]|jgi:hypothetical protein|nr:hypothetical protein [Dysgonamonadaceae bacterium]